MGKIVQEKAGDDSGRKNAYVTSHCIRLQVGEGKR